MRNAAYGLLKGDYATNVRRLLSDGRAYAARSDELLDRNREKKNVVNPWSVIKL